MWYKCVVIVVAFGAVVATPQVFESVSFKVGIEYDHSLPMTGGSDRYRHRHNYEPFYVTVTTSAKKGFVLSYLEVKATIDEGGKVKFNLIRGQTGSRTMTFQLTSNHSDFLFYSYLSYGIREEQYKKIANIITLPIGNNGKTVQFNTTMFLFIVSMIIILS